MHLCGCVQAWCNMCVEVRGQLWGLNSGSGLHDKCLTLWTVTPGQELIFRKVSRKSGWVKADATMPDNPYGGRRKLTQVPSDVPTCTAAYTHTHMWIYICMHAHIHVHKYTCTHTHTHIPALVYTHMPPHTCISTCVHICIPTYLHLCAHTYAHTQKWK